MGIMVSMHPVTDGKEYQIEFGKNLKSEQIQHFLPAEWYPQSGVQLTWPHKDTDWAYMLEEVEECFVDIAKEIAKREILLIVTPEPQRVKQLLLERGINENNLRFFECDTNDTWARDHGAITLMGGEKPYLIDFKFNGWGLKFASDKDNLITQKAFKAGHLNGLYSSALSFVLEGGSIESDGKGTILTTSECLLSPNRNGGMIKEEITQYLCSRFGAKRVLWLDHGYLSGDDTDSHIDTLARFCSEDTIAYVRCDNSSDEHYKALFEMEKQLKQFKQDNGEPYKLVALPMADKIEFEGERLPATYANFLIMNEVVLYPTYHQHDNDMKAKQVLQTAFPNHEIIGIDCRALIKQHGSLHCVTMQYPKGVLK